MPKPDKTFLPSKGFMRDIQPANLPDPQINGPALDRLITNRGLRFLHEKASYCPNIINNSLETDSHDPNCMICQGGFIYYGAEEIVGAIYNNKLQQIYQAEGAWGTGEAVLTFPAYQDGPDGTPSTGPANEFSVFDRLICLDYSVRFAEKIQHSSTTLDKLKYSPIKIDFLASKNRVFNEGSDFSINEKGFIQWTGTNLPSVDAFNNHGEILTVSYYTHPQFLVISLVHELRATRSNGKAIRLPQNIIVRRDNLVQNNPSGNQNDTQNGIGNTDIPSDGGNVF
jgi:hypothetical protein